MRNCRERIAAMKTKMKPWDSERLASWAAFEWHGMDMPEFVAACDAADEKLRAGLEARSGATLTAREVEALVRDRERIANHTKVLQGCVWRIMQLTKIYEDEPEKLLD